MLHLKPLPKTRQDSYYPNGGTYWCWGRAIKLDDNTYQQVQATQVCKDYIVDTFYRTRLENLPAMHEQDNCFFIYIPEDRKELFHKNVKDFLHPYEAAHGYSLTKVQQVTKKVTPCTTKKPVIIEGSPLWMQNTYTISHYLSLLRLCGYHKDLSLTSTGTPAVSRCNETGYIASMAPPCKQAFMHIWQNPHFLDMDAPVGHHAMSLYAQGYNGHGVGGTFFAMQLMQPHAWANTADIARYVRGNPMLKKIKELIRRINSNESLQGL